MSRAGRVVLLVAAWLAVVALGSGLVWTVISATGSELAGSNDAVPLPPDGTVTTAPVPATSAATDSPRPSGSPRTASASPTPPSTATPRPSTSTTATPAAPTARTATWSGSAGVVTTRCVGSRISLVRAVPSADGYRVEVNDRGPGVVEVEFEGRGEDTEAETEVTARCVGGAPRYSVER